MLFLLGTGLGRLSGQQQFPGANSGGVSLTPSGTSQTITPGDTTSVPLTIVGASGTSVDLFDVEVNGGSKAFSSNNLGTVFQIGAGAGGATINCSPGGGNCIIAPSANGITLLGGGGAGSVTFRTNNTIGIGVGVTSPGVHLTLNAANEDIAGTLTCSGGTISKTFSTAYTSTPTILIEDDTTIGGARVSAKSNTAFTVTCTGATDAITYFTIGNPN